MQFLSFVWIMTLASYIATFVPILMIFTRVVWKVSSLAYNRRETQDKRLLVRDPDRSLCHCQSVGNLRIIQKILLIWDLSLDCLMDISEIETRVMSGKWQYFLPLLIIPVNHVGSVTKGPGLTFLNFFYSQNKRTARVAPLSISREIYNIGMFDVVVSILKFAEDGFHKLN